MTTERNYNNLSDDLAILQERISQAEQILRIDKLAYSDNPNPEDRKSIQILEQSINQLKDQLNKLGNPPRIK